MTCKDFTLIANALKVSKPNDGNSYNIGTDIEETADFRAYNTWRTTCENFADALATTNTQFDRAKFLAACGYNAE